MIRTLVVVACLATPVSVFAQTPEAEVAPPRCALLAQVSTSSLLRLAAALSEGAEVAIDRHSARLADLTQSYATLGCDTEALGQTFDCVLSGAGDGATRAVARQCLASAGLIPALP